jgi:hypothetical protein
LPENIATPKVAMKIIRGSFEGDHLSDLICCDAHNPKGASSEDLVSQGKQPLLGLQIFTPIYSLLSMRIFRNHVYKASYGFDQHYAIISCLTLFRFASLAKQLFEHPRKVFAMLVQKF